MANPLATHTRARDDFGPDPLIAVAPLAPRWPERARVACASALDAPFTH